MPSGPQKENELILQFFLFLLILCFRLNFTWDGNLFVGAQNTLEALVALFLSHKGDEFTLKTFFFFSTLLMVNFRCLYDRWNFVVNWLVETIVNFYFDYFLF